MHVFVTAGKLQTLRANLLLLHEQGRPLQPQEADAAHPWQWGREGRTVGKKVLHSDLVSKTYWLIFLWANDFIVWASVRE